MREIERSGVVQGWPDIMVAPTKSQLLQAIARAQRNGELGAVGMLTHTTQLWYVRVVRLKAAARRRRFWPWALAGGVLVLALLFLVGWFLVTALIAVLPMIGSVIGVLVVGGLIMSDRGCTITHTRP